MLAIIKNDWKRLWEEKIYILISMGLTICSVIAAIAITNVAEIKGNIALVVSKQQFVSETVSKFEQSPYFNVKVVEQEPPESELLQNRYDAIVVIKKDGTYEIKTIKSDETKSLLETALLNPATFVPNTDKERKIGTNIIGYMMMFLLLQGILYAKLYADDKEKHMIERVVTSPIAFWKYLAGHAVFMDAILFVPAYLVIVVAKLTGATIGFSLLTYAGLIVILTTLSVAFALFLNSFFSVADTANMLGSALITLTSILAGSFYSFAKEETLFDKLLHLLPQKDFINFVNALEKGNITRDISYQFVYIIILIAVFFAIAVIKTRKDYVYKG
jgi:ABC-2 type transport system permease protein